MTIPHEAHPHRAGTALAALTVVTAAPAVGAAPRTAVPAPSDHAASGDQALRTLARRAGIRIGTAVDMSALAQDATHRSHLAWEFSTVTAENVTKWEVTERQRGVHDW